MILLSSSHSNVIVNNNDLLHRPQIILDYNQWKGGVDQLDENLAEFTYARKTVRLPLIVFYYIIDVSTNNAFVHIQRNGYSKTRKEFLRALSLQMAEPFDKSRHSLNRGLHKKIRMASELFNFLPPAVPNRQNEICQLGRCHDCSKVTRASCGRCRRFVCAAHKVLTKLCLCQDC